jgi:DNA-directed RNA polymerase specialized sigma24 family protein
VIKIEINPNDLQALLELLGELGITTTAPETQTQTQAKPRGSKAGVARGKYNTKRKQEVLDGLIRTESVIKDSRNIIKEATANLNQARELNQDLLVEARKRGITNVEIANALGVTDATIIGRYHTARKHIRKRNTTK